MNLETIKLSEELTIHQRIDVGIRGMLYLIILLLSSSFLYLIFISPVIFAQYIRKNIEHRSDIISARIYPFILSLNTTRKSSENRSSEKTDKILSTVYSLI